MPTGTLMAEQKKVRDYYSREAASYSAASKQGLWDWWRRRELRAVLSILMPQPDELILDAGSGAGFYSEHLRASGAEVIAVDFSVAMAREVRRRLGVTSFAADLQTIALQPRLDAILCAGALEFCPNPEEAVRRLALGLKQQPHARLVLMLPGDGITGRLYRRFHKRHGFDIQLFPQERLNAMAKSANLELVTIRRLGFNHVVRLRGRWDTIAKKKRM